MALHEELRHLVTAMQRIIRLEALCVLAFFSCTDGPTVSPMGNMQGDSGSVSDTAVDGNTTPRDAGIDARTDAHVDSEVQRPETALTNSGALSIDLQPDRDVLIIRHSGQERFELPINGFQLGTVDVVDYDTNYDPFYIFDEIPGTTPPTLAWHEASLGDIDVQEDTVTLGLDYGMLGLGQLVISVTAERRLTVRFTGPEAPVAYLRLQPRTSATEAFYGLGEVFDDVNHRGKIRAMQLELDVQIESSNNEAHVPIPVIYGHSGWGLFVESLRPGVFAVATADEETVDVIFGTGVASDEGLQFHIFTEDKPLDLTRHYYDLTGYPRLPAQWAYGPWIWRDENDNEAQVRADIQTIRDLDLATSGYWIDRPYASAVNSFDWDPRKFDDPQGMIAQIHDLGFRFALWHTPYVGVEERGRELTEATAELRATALEQGYYPPSIGIVTSTWGSPVDLTNPEAYQWWQSLIRRYSDAGVEGYKLDYAEDIVPGLYLRRAGWEFADGSNDQTMHARYQTLYHQVYAETLPETGGFMLCRSATWGGQTNVVIIWPGDLDANFAAHREVVQDGDGDYVAVGGLRASVIAGLSLGPSGFPFFGSDTGGYRRAPPSKEVFTRWFQQTALSSVMQVGTNTNNVAWEFSEETGFDEEMLDWYRIYTRLHLRLFPYAWSYAHQIEATGRPIQRPYGLQYPEMGIHPSDTYFFGDDLLVAPVLMDGQRQRNVPFPPGVWYDWWTGLPMEGDQTHLVEAPLSTLPLYLRGGAIVPMLRPNIDTLSPTTVLEIESYANDPGRLYVRIALGADHRFELFDGTQISHRTTDTETTISSTLGTTFGAERQYEIIGLTEAPSTVQVGDTVISAADTLESGWIYDENKRMLTIRVNELADVTINQSR